MSLPLALVVAVADNGIIGRDNGLAWHLRTDLKRFRALTMGRPLLMGRRTFESIGRPLPGRETVVLTSDPSFSVEGVTAAASLAGAIAACEASARRLGADTIMVVGGAQVYAETLPLASRIHLTEVHANPEGDVRFPELERTAFRETLREAHQAGPQDDFPFTFVDLERVGATTSAVLH